MASDSPLNGAGPSGSTAPTSFAEQLQSRHADAAHKATIEEVVDEDDVQHPPPSALLAHPQEQGDPEQNLSAKAMGKQKVSEKQAPAASPAPLDTQSEELFPALGGPKSRAPAKAPAWGSSTPPSLADGFTNGTRANIASRPSSVATSGRSTPVTTPLSPNFASSNVRGTGAVRLPGKSTDKFSMRPSQLLPRTQLKKPVQDVLRDINRKSRAKVTMRPAADGGIEFEATGPTAEIVQQALRDVSKEVGAKQVLKMPIPATARPHIIGSQGRTIKEIKELSGANLQMPKAEEIPPDADDGFMVPLTIEGDAISAVIAQREVQNILSRKAANMNVRLRDIPPELYPFIAGPRNAHIESLIGDRAVDIRVPPYHTWSHQPPPATSSHADIPNFTPHPSHHIVISGNRQAVQDARAEIERQANLLRKQIGLSQLDISRGQHQFVAGVNGESLHDLLHETGCSVIMPPSSDDSETIFVCGPRDRLELGVDQVMNLATSMRSANVDIGRSFPNPPMGAQAYTRALTRYLQQRRAIQELERLHDSHIVLPAPLDGSSTWEVYSREGKNTIKAKTDILNLVNAHPPARFRHIDVDPFFQSHLHERHANRILQDHGVRMILPEEVESPQVILIYEGPSSAQESNASRQKPSQADVAEFEKALLTAQDEIFRMFADQQAIGTRSVQIPNKFREKTRKFVARDQSTLLNDMYPIEFISRPTNGSLNGSAPEGGIPTHDCFLRGPEDDLEALLEKVSEFIEAEKRDELERDYTTGFDFPQKFSHHLIGKRGENIHKLREEFDVEIQVRDGKVEIKGPKTKAHACQSRVQSMAKKLEDEVTYKLKIDPQFHRDLIGAKGGQVNRLQDRYNVRIRFPRSTQNGLDDNVSMDGSEVGTPRGGRPSDEILVVGPKRGADEARDEILSLAKYLIDNSHVAAVSVSKSQLPSLIGAGGRNMGNIRQTTGAQINVPASNEAADAAGRVELKIKGTTKQVDEAKKLLGQSIKVFDDSIKREVEVDKKYHKALIGSGGANLRNIVVQAGGSDDRRELSRTVRFPRPDSPSSTISIEGSKPVVEKIASAISAFVAQRESEVTQTVEVPPERHGLLIGPGGETRRTLEEQHRVKIDIPKQSVQGAARAQIKLVGAQPDIDAIRARILELVQGPPGETVEVPRNLHHAVSDNGAFFRRLRADLRVTVDHAGQPPPPKPAAGAANGARNGPLPLITDDEASDEPTWTVVDRSPSPASEESGTIPWVLRGPTPEAAANAKALLLKALDGAKAPAVAGYLVLPDPRTHGLVIGAGGAQINAIRRATGCRINVPKDKARGEPIEVLGGKDGVEKAREMILEAVKSGRRRE